MKHARLFIWLLALAPMLFVARAAAQSPRDEARELAREGIELIGKGQHQEGLDKLRQAEAKFHAPTHLIYMARALTELNKPIEAHALYVDVLVEKVPNYAPDAFHEAQKTALGEARALEARIAAVRVTVSGAEIERTTVTVDGTEVPVARLAHPIALEAGTHRVEASAPGTAAAASDVEAKVGSVAEVSLELVPESGATSGETGGDGPTDGDEEGGSALPIGAGIALGIGGAALVVGVVTGVVTLTRSDEIKESCVDNVCPPDKESEADDAKLLGNVSTAMFAVGGAGVALGAVLLIVSATQDEQARAGVRVGVGPTGVMVYGRF
jgi:hypothetical protein